MSAPVAINITFSHTPNNFLADLNGFIDFLNANQLTVISDNVLLGGSGSVLPSTNIGPFLLTPQNVWYVWDATALAYVAQANTDFIGTVIAFAYGSGSPSVDSTRWVECDGRGIPRAAPYDQLYGKIGTTYGVGNGSTTFNVPNIPDLVDSGGHHLVYYIRYA